MMQSEKGRSTIFRRRTIKHIKITKNAPSSKQTDRTDRKAFNSLKLTDYLEEDEEEGDHTKLIIIIIILPSVDMFPREFKN